MNLHGLMTLLDRLLYSFTAEGNSNSNDESSSAHHASATTTDLLLRPYGRIFRMKGVFHIHNEEYLYLMQAVHDVFDIQPSSFKCRSNDDTTGGLNSVILIGKNLDPVYVETEIKKCLKSL